MLLYQSVRDDTSIELLAYSPKKMVVAVNRQ